MGFAGAHSVEKPPHLGRFVGLVARCLDTPTGFRGELASHDLIELVQLVLMTTSSGALHIIAPEGRGTLWLEHGASAELRPSSTCCTGPEAASAWTRARSHP